MIVLLEIPPAVGGFDALAPLLPPGTAARLGDGPVAGKRLVATDRPLCEVLPLLPDARLWLVLLADPVSTLAFRWARAQEDAADPLHALANTFTAAEAATLGVPGVADGALARHLSADGKAASPAEVIAHIDTVPMVVGFAQNPNVFAAAAEAALGLAKGAVDPAVIVSRARGVPKGAREPIAVRYAADIALYEALLAHRGEARVYRTPAARR